MENQFLRPLFGLMADQPEEIVEALTIQEMRTHRRLVDEGQLVYDQMRRSNEDPAAEHAYLSKMIEIHAQQMALTTLFEILGRIPHVPPSTAH